VEKNCAAWFARHGFQLLAGIRTLPEWRMAGKRQGLISVNKAGAV
jgi:hypothetical protein